MNKDEALEAVRLISPKLVISCHIMFFWKKNVNPADDRYFKKQWRIWVLSAGSWVVRMRLYFRSVIFKFLKQVIAYNHSFNPDWLFCWRSFASRLTAPLGT
jgi:hypothetical protein